MAILGKTPVRTGRPDLVMQSLTTLDLHIATARSDTEVAVWGQEADPEHVLEQAKHLLSISVDGDARDSVLRG